jgi:hypothetical protein
MKTLGLDDKQHGNGDECDAALDDDGNIRHKTSHAPQDHRGLCMADGVKLTPADLREDKPEEQR